MNANPTPIAESSVQTSEFDLGEIVILEVRPSHAVQPGAPQLGGAGIGPGQAVLQVQQHFRVFLMLPHLGRGHQHRTDTLG